jgi:starch-binding outer membrane protein, SusD/RagB family
MKTIRSVAHLVRVAALALALPLTACILDVFDPDTAKPGNFDDPKFIDVQVAGAIGDFAVAYSGPGGTDTYLAGVAAITDEFFNSETFPTRTATDRRLQQPPANGNSADEAYVELQQARRALKFAAAALAAHPDRGTGHPHYAELNALHGYTYVALGEGFCSYVPIANDDGPFPAPGLPRTSRQLFDESLPLFDAAGGTSLANIGKARALMNLGRYSEAAALVAGVPTTFNYFIEHSSTTGRENNPFFSLQSNGRWSLAHREGGDTTGMPFRGTSPNANADEDPRVFGANYVPVGQDPRIPWFEDPAGGFDPQFRLFVQLKYPFRDSDVPLASGIEARLIEAEAALAGGSGNWLNILNALRDSVGILMAGQIDNYVAWVANPTLPALTDPGTLAAQVDLLFQERAFWLWGTGTRLGDLRRLVNQYGRTADSVYPSGAYHKGGSHGPDVVFPVDFDEVNNELFGGASGQYPSQCDVTRASID